MTGNRIEWNGEGGIVLRGPNHYNITGNYIDRSFQAGIDLEGRDDFAAQQITITGNLIYRSGRESEPGSDRSAHVRMVHCEGITLTGNTMVVGRDDGGKGRWSPENGMVLGRLRNCVVCNNVLHRGALKELLVDLGEHAEGVIIRDNPGGLFHPEA